MSLRTTNDVHGHGFATVDGFNVGQGDNVVMRTLAIIVGACTLAASLPSCYVGPSETRRAPGAPATSSGRSPSARPEPQACSTAEFAGVRLQNQVRPSIVRIEHNAGMATGFVVKHPSDGILIVTNYHVIRGGSRFDAIFDSGARLGNIEIAKIDIDHDLALLKAPGIVRAAPGLELSSQGVVLAEHVAAMGYPYVAGENKPSLTFEDGTVTNTSTELAGRTFIRTNANINPGNSGGPVIDACAHVVGIVAAFHTATQRTGLIIPVGDLRNLLAASDAPRGEPQTEVASRIKALETAVRYKRGEDVAAMFSRRMLADTAMKSFLRIIDRSTESAQSKINAYLISTASEGKPVTVEGRTITDFNALPQEAREKLVNVLLDDAEKENVRLKDRIMKHEIDEYTAMSTWLGPFAHNLFGADPTFRIDHVTVTGPHALKTQVMIGASASARFEEFSWVYEWGDWRIDAFACVRGCD